MTSSSLTRATKEEGEGAAKLLEGLLRESCLLVNLLVAVALREVLRRGHREEVPRVEVEEVTEGGITKEELIMR